MIYAQSDHPGPGELLPDRGVQEGLPGPGQPPVAATYKWALRRHPRKGRRWVTARYFGLFNPHRHNQWVFGDRESGAYLHQYAWTKIVRHAWSPAGHSPDDPALTQYWADRRRSRNAPQLAALLAHRPAGPARALPPMRGTAARRRPPPDSPRQGETWYAAVRKAMTRQASTDSSGGRTQHRLVHAHCASRHPDGDRTARNSRRTEPARPRGLLEPGAATSGKQGSEEGAAGKRRPLSDNKSHYVRDTIYREDDSQAWAGEGPQAIASLRNLAHGLFRLEESEPHQGNRRMGLPRPDAGTPIHDYKALRRTRSVILILGLARLVSAMAFHSHEMSTSSTRISMHVLEYSLTLSRSCRRSPCSLFHHSGRQSGRIRAAVWLRHCSMSQRPDRPTRASALLSGSRAVLWTACGLTQDTKEHNFILVDQQPKE